MNTETVIEYIKANPGATKAVISENTGAKGIVLHNILQKLISDGLIAGTGDGKSATYEAAEPVSEEITIVNDDEKGQEEQESNETTEHSETEPPAETKMPSVVKPAIATRNNDKFKFMGQELGKGPLCRELVRQIVADNPGISFKKLNDLMPQSLIPRFGLYEEVEAARKLSGQKYDRYFFKDEYVIKLKDKKIVVCNQLTSQLLSGVIAKAKESGYKIK